MEYPFARAVASIESQGICGPLGKSGIYAGPMGLHRAYCREKFGVDPLDPRDNIRIGVRALRGKDKLAVLKRYNRTWWQDNYLRDTMALYRQLKRQGK